MYKGTMRLADIRTAINLHLSTFGMVYMFDLGCDRWTVMKRDDAAKRMVRLYSFDSFWDIIPNWKIFNLP